MPSDSTGEFHVENMGSESGPGTAVVRGTVLYYLTTGVSNQVKLVTCDIGPLQKGDIGSVTSNDRWQKLNLVEKLADSNGAQVHTNFRPATVLLDETLYFFWVDTTQSGQVYAASMAKDGRFSTYAYKVTVSTRSTPDDLKASSDLSANVSPSGGAIALNWFVPETLRLATLVLDPKEIDNGIAQWRGDRKNDVFLSGRPALPLGPSHSRISTTWFTQGRSDNFMIASFYSLQAHTVYFLLYKIHPLGDPVDMQRGKAFTIRDLEVRRGFTISRDPAGRIYGVYCQADPDHTYIYFRIFNTNQEIKKTTVPNSPDLEWGAQSLLNGISSNSEKAPTVAFVVGDLATTVRSQRPAQILNLESTNSKQYSIALYAANNKSGDNAYNVQCQAALYGTSFVVPGYTTISPDEEYKKQRLLGLLEDSFPFPDENLGTGITLNHRIIQYTYGASSSSVLSAMTAIEALRGVKVSLTTTKGFGLATALEFASGTIANLASTSTTVQTDGYSVDTTPILAPPGSRTQNKIEAHGAYYGTTPLTLIEDIGLFQERSSGKIVNGSTAPRFSAIRTDGSKVARVTGQYSTFCYTPGDIHSYEEAAINKKMSDLYSGLSSSKKDRLGKGYATGYIQNVIVPNAQTIFGRDFLQFTIGGSGASTTELKTINEIVSTFGFSIKGSSYIGVSGGEELSVFALGAGFSFSVLEGVDYNSSTISGVGNTSTWGIAFLNSNIPTGVRGALAYTVNMYICKPSNLWAREVEYFSDDTREAQSIDFDHSRPSKIMFVVSQIQETAIPRR